MNNVLPCFCSKYITPQWFKGQSTVPQISCRIETQERFYLRQLRSMFRSFIGPFKLTMLCKNAPAVDQPIISILQPHLRVPLLYLHTPLSASSKPNCPSNSRCIRVPGDDSSFQDSCRLRGYALGQRGLWMTPPAAVTVMFSSFWYMSVMRRFSVSDCN